MSLPVVIVGAGGHGRGTLEILRARRAAGLSSPEVLGFVDDHRGQTPIDGLPLLGDGDWLTEHAGEVSAILAIASAEAKIKLAACFDAAGLGWATAVHPSAIIGGRTEIEAGAIIGAGVVIAYDTRVGRHTTINLNATVGHDCVIGAFSTVAPGVNITGNVVLEEGVEIQTNATIVPGLRLGRGSRVGPGSVVLKDVGEGEFFFGNPARRMPDPSK